MSHGKVGIKQLQLIEAIKQLSMQDQLFIVQQVIIGIQGENLNEDKQLESRKKAAEMLAHDYKSQEELTAFTALDKEDIYEQAEIWLVNLDPTIGAEIQKTRPSIIVSDDTLGVLPLRVIVPITDWKDRYTAADWLVKIEPDELNNLSKVTAADCFQVRSVSNTRMTKKIGEIKTEKMKEIAQALSNVLRLIQ